MKKMFRNFCFIGLLMFVASCTNQVKNDIVQHSVKDTSDATNDFFDNEDVVELNFGKLEIAGEIENPGFVNFEQLNLHSVIVKETVFEGEKDRFVGAYKYNGYSLYDILNNVKLNKKNKEEFNPIIDIFVEIENANGEKVIVSWGEIYYPNHLHEIIIAKQVMRIVPSKTKELWPLPVDNKLVVAADLITERNISNPTKITVKSYPKSFKTVKGMSPAYSPEISIYNENELCEKLTALPEGCMTTLHTIFYGRGRGIHSTQPFTGVKLQDILARHTAFDKHNIREGIVLVVAKDGYRTVYTFSELFNRNDQAEVLLVENKQDTLFGIFRTFPSCDFFSDRAVKGITEVYYSTSQQ
jgi:hypothetical protein